MGKIDKLQQARMDGMCRALEITKDKGVDALEAEIRFRNATGLQLDVNMEAAEAAIAKVAERIYMTLLITLIEEKNGYTKKRTRRCRVTGKYRRVFTVQPGPCVMSFKYVDLLIGDGVEYDKKRKSA